MPRPPLPSELRRRFVDAATRELYAGVGLVSGRVIDSVGRPVRGAHVELLIGRGSTMTALTGDFAMFAPAGPAAIRITAPGYLPTTVRSLDIEAREELRADVTLRPRVPKVVPRLWHDGQRHRESMR